MVTNREILANAYNNAGREFLAYRLTRVFAKIENNEDTALHNDVIRELESMLAEHSIAALKDIADVILQYSKKGLT